ncbi:Eco57I restriction-modification methylase domain-containing protein [Chlorobium limicola]
MSKPDTEIKISIEKAIMAFSGGSLTENAINLFKALGYNTDRQQPLPEKNFTCFKEYYLDSGSRFNEEKSLATEWQQIDLLFQLTKEEVTAQNSLFNTAQVDRTIIEAYLFFCIELNDREYTRTALSQITREINKAFKMPVMVLFKLGDKLSLAVINRRLHKKDPDKDVLEKVTLIKDINIPKPHRAHIEILFDLSIEELQRVHKFTNFVELQKAWQNALDTKELNKRFYRDLSNWYFWAKEQVSFPDDVVKDREERNSTSLIRLITRVIFIWFIKEKNLVPDTLFHSKSCKRLVKDFMQGDSSNYYNAVLQNLFFGTLNQKISERKFVADEEFPENRNEYGVKNLFRYQNLLLIDRQEALQLFHDVPFLNGGLFDCLDKQNDAGKVEYQDGFSRNTKKQAHVPDYLFFKDETDINLNDVYGTKNKSYKVRGLIDLLNRYKFTVSESTPVEEEVALDPELLGEVFENLLASYNPETQSTARKQTGSFYTPREIVDYMVNESLKASLKQKLVSSTEMKEDDAEVGLNILFSYTEKKHAFTDSERKSLIEAIDDCKVLDPACGSGAFPMGILQKLVYVLHKLDPDNALWKEQQRQKAIKETEDAFRIGDQKERDTRLKEISEVFENNAGDYGRKLYLIEHCIYGVDIQPIAAQISKLRFFISLIIEQQSSGHRENNFGIRPLPNLETRFVTANTLIGLGKPVLRNNAIIILEDELKELRHKYFSAGTRKEKLAYQKKDKEIRAKISRVLIDDGFLKDFADQIAAFDPYDQNKKSPFFDMEWMFTLTDGFDVVIGNPPYVQLQKLKGNPLQSAYKDQQYSTYDANGDVYCLFYEKGITLLRNHGVLAFITSNKWMRAGYGEKLRKYLSSYNPLVLLDLGPGVFDSATVDTNILLVGKEKNKKQLIAATLSGNSSDKFAIGTYMHTHGITLSSIGKDAWFIGNQAALNLKEKIERIGKPLKEWDLKIYFGIKTGLNAAFIIDTEKRDVLIEQDSKSSKIIKPILRGRDVSKYGYEWAGLWLIIAKYGSYKTLSIDYPAVFNYLKQFEKELKKRGQCQYSRSGKNSIGNEYIGQHHWLELDNNPKDDYLEEFAKEKLVWKRIGSILRFGYDSSGVYCQDSTCIMTGNNLKYLCAYMNSRLGNQLLFDKAPKTGTGDLIVSVQAIDPLLVPPITSQNRPVIEKIESLVDEILMLNKENKKFDIQEREIDQLVYQLYDLTPEEIAIIKKQP